jgi:hypothetical protein
MANVLQEFLVSLKYQQDQSSQRRFFSDLKEGERSAMSFGKKVGLLGAAVVGMGIVAAKGTLQYSKALEQLYFSANRTGTGIKKLRGMMIGSESLGSSADEALGSIENLASFMRRNPMGSASFMKSIGVDAFSNGKMRDKVDIMNDLSKSFQKMKAAGNEYLVYQYADHFGIGEHQALAMLDPGYVATSGKFTNAQGTGVDEAGASAHRLQNENRELEARAFGMTAKTMTPVMDTLTKTLQLTNKELNDLNGWASSIVGLWNANKAMGNPAGIAAGAAGAAYVGKKLLSKGATGAAAGGSFLSRWFPGLALMGYSSNLNEGEDQEIAKMRGQDKRVTAIKHLKRMGYTDSQAIGMVANFSAESSMNHKAVGDGGKAFGLAQWHPHRQADFEKMFGFPIQKSSFEDQVEFAGWELRNKFPSVWKKMQAAGSNHRLQADIVSRGYEIPKDAEGEASKRAGIAQSIHTTINVTGQKDPQSTATAISREQIRVNQQLARNTTGATR